MKTKIEITCEKGEPIGEHLLIALENAISIIKEEMECQKFQTKIKRFSANSANSFGHCEIKISE